MFNVSQNFHNAVRAQSPDVRMLIEFANGVTLRGADISASRGLTFTENANMDENIEIGTTPSSSVSFTLINKNGLLDDFEYGQFSVYAGVKTTSEPYASSINAQVFAVANYGSDDAVRIEGHADTPYLTVNGVAPSIQPPWPVEGIAVMGNALYLVSASGAVWSATLSGSTISGGAIKPDLTQFQVMQAAGFAAEHRGIVRDGLQSLDFYASGTVATWEYCPLGVFNAALPERRRIALIDVNANDLMLNFDVEADQWLASLTFPMTLGEMLASLCEFVGLEAESTTFTNSTLSYDASPIATQFVPARNILGWIAQAAGCYACMTRIGKVALRTFTANNQIFSDTTIFNIEQSEFDVAVIDKLQVSVTDNDIGVIVGDGVNGYQILNNPFLYGESDADIRAKVEPIYTALNGIAPYRPATVSVVGDWSIESGDIVGIDLDGSVHSMPIFVQTLQFRGGSPRAELEATGTATRPVMSAVNRQTIQDGKKYHNIVVSVDSLESTVAEQAEQMTEIATSVIQDAQQIILSALESYVTTQDYDAFKESISTTLRILSDQVELNFVTSTQQIGSVDGALQDFINEQVKYIRFIDGNIVLGEEGNEFVLKLENERISFLQNDTEIAYFANYKIHAADGEFETSVSIGNFQWVYLPDGSFALV